MAAKVDVAPLSADAEEAIAALEEAHAAEMQQLKDKVVKVALKIKKERGFCEIVDEALIEAGVVPPPIRVVVEVSMKGTLIVELRNLTGVVDQAVIDAAVQKGLKRDGIAINSKDETALEIVSRDWTSDKKIEFHSISDPSEVPVAGAYGEPFGFIVRYKDPYAAKVLHFVNPSSGYSLCGDYISTGYESSTVGTGEVCRRCAQRAERRIANANG